MLFNFLLLGIISTAFCGYLPPENGYDGNETPSCSCDETRMSELSARIARLEDQNRSFRQRRQAGDGLMAFTAYLTHNSNAMTIGQAIVFDKALLNHGGGYDTTTGRFTAPSAGIYMFSFIIESKHSVDTAARLVVDGTNYLDAVSEPRHSEQNVQGGNVGVVQLTAGQQVWVEVYNSGSQNYEGGEPYRFTTFTGVLLFNME